VRWCLQPRASSCLAKQSPHLPIGTAEVSRRGALSGTDSSFVAIARSSRQSELEWRAASGLDLCSMMPFVEDEGRIQAIGPSISLRAQAAQFLGIILHELATNASKYGALSVPAGKTGKCSIELRMVAGWRARATGLNAGAKIRRDHAGLGIRNQQIVTAVAARAPSPSPVSGDIRCWGGSGRWWGGPWAAPPRSILRIPAVRDLG